jgi:L-glyceraldehyde 3-phosphate reductase
VGYGDRRPVGFAGRRGLVEQGETRLQGAIVQPVAEPGERVVRDHRDRRAARNRTHAPLSSRSRGAVDWPADCGLRWAGPRSSGGAALGHVPAPNRYASMRYNRCGASGLLLPAVSLGLWHNFGGDAPSRASRLMIRRAFDLGITHFDLANNYGPPPGSAEGNFGRVLREDLAAHRDEMVISTKAGYLMWEGPYGEWGSRKHLLASLDQSLRRTRLDHVDVFYHHRPDPQTPQAETMGALDTAVRQGKARYVGISNYRPPEAKQAIAQLKAMGTPCLIEQPSYSMLNRWVEDGLLDLLHEEGVGCIAFSPLAKGLLTNRYLEGIPPPTRAPPAPTRSSRSRTSPRDCAPG